MQHEPLLEAPMNRTFDLSSPPTPGVMNHRIPRGVAQAAAWVLVALITVADRLTGPYLVFSIFYLVPVAIAAWYCTRAKALAFSFLTAGAGALVIGLNPGAMSVTVVAMNSIFRLVIFIGAVFLIDAERDARSRIAMLSTTDPLTGLFNRRAFVTLGTDHLHLGARIGEPVTLVYVDIDDLKSRNDTFGHDAGDQLIVTFAEVAVATFRDVDLLTRIGGDEFCFLLTGTDWAEAEAVLARFKAALAGAEPTPIGASMGAVTTVPTAETEMIQLIREADAAMYAAKRSGKGRHLTRMARTDPAVWRHGSEAS